MNKNQRNNYESKQNFNECKEFFVYSQKLFIESDSRFSNRDSRLTGSHTRRMQDYRSPRSSPNLFRKTESIAFDTPRHVEYDLEEEARSSNVLIQR